METIAQKELRSQDQLVKLEQKDVEHYLEHIDPEQFWEDLGRRIREGIRISLEQTIRHEFQQFIAALEYEKSPRRKDVRNGYRSRDFGSIYGVIENMKIPGQEIALSQLGYCLALRGDQEELAALSREIFLRGLSTRDVKRISKHIYGENYSPGLRPGFKKQLEEAFSLWPNRPIERRI